MNTQNFPHVEMKKRGRPSLTAVKASTPINLVIEPVRLNDIEFDENIFIPVQTGHPLIDKFISLILFFLKIFLLLMFDSSFEKLPLLSFVLI